MIALLVIVFSFLLNTNPALKTELDSYLKIQLSHYNSWEYEIVRMPENTRKIEIIKENQLNIQGNMAYVPVKITDSSGRKAKSFLTLRIKLFQKALISTKTIERKMDITGADVSYKLVDVSQLQGTPISSIEEIKSLRSKIHIIPGTVLLKEMMEEIPVVRFGDRVTASVIYGNVLVTTEATAKQDGTVGEIISVVTSDRKEFKAKVIDFKNVSIVE